MIKLKTNGAGPVQLTGLAKNLLISALVVISLSATSCTPVEKEVVPEFPVSQTITFSSADEVQTLAFSANMDWTLTSSESWCAFIGEDGEECYSVHGQAGEQTVQVKVSADAQQVGEGSDKAKILLMMGMQDEVIAEIVRTSQEFSFEVLDAEGNPLPAATRCIKVGFGDYVSFRVKANFKFMTTLCPGIELAGETLAGVRDQIVVGKVRIIEDGETERTPIAFPEVADASNSICFSSEDSKVKFYVPVVYEGIPSDYIVIDDMNASRKDWQVSASGKTFTQIGGGQPYMGNGDAVIYAADGGLSYTITANHEGVKFLYVDVKEDGSMRDSKDVAAVDWMSMKKTEWGDWALSVKAGDPCKGYVLAIPSALYDKVADGNLYVAADGSFNYAACDRYLVAELQRMEALPLYDIQMYDQWAAEPWSTASYSKVTDPALIEKYGCKEVYEVHQDGYQFKVTPNIEAQYSGELLLENITEPSAVTMDSWQAPFEVFFDGDLYGDQRAVLKFTDMEGNVVSVLIFTLNSWA